MKQNTQNTIKKQMLLSIPYIALLTLFIFTVIIDIFTGRFDVLFYLMILLILCDVVLVTISYRTMVKWLNEVE